MYLLKGCHECSFNHLLTTLGMGHAVDFPSSFVLSYIFPQHSYSLWSCMSHLEGLYVFLPKHAWRSQAVSAPGRKCKRYTRMTDEKGERNGVSVPSVWHSFDFEVCLSGRPGTWIGPTAKWSKSKENTKPDQYSRIIERGAAGLKSTLKEPSHHTLISTISQRTSGFNDSNKDFELIRLICMKGFSGQNPSFLCFSPVITSDHWLALVTMSDNG